MWFIKEQSSDCFFYAMILFESVPHVIVIAEEGVRLLMDLFSRYGCDRIFLTFA